MMWKNYLIMRRKPMMLLCMTVVPACWSLLVLVARSHTTLSARLEPKAFSPILPDICDHHHGHEYYCRKDAVLTAYYTPDVPAARLMMGYAEHKMGEYSN